MSLQIWKENQILYDNNIKAHRSKSSEYFRNPQKATKFVVVMTRDIVTYCSKQVEMRGV
jgi:hypothetical protein